MSSSLVSCGQCGAPHARPSGVTHLLCEFCGSSIRFDNQPDHEELVCPVPYSRDLCEETTLRELVARGHRDFRLRCETPRWIAVWQITSRHGEQEIRPADPAAGALDRRLGLPALPLVDRSLAGEGALEEFPPRPPLDASSVHDAARNFFAEPDQEAAHLRLVWFRVVDVEVTLSGVTAWGAYVVGADRVVLPDSSIAPALPPPAVGLLIRYGLFVTLCAVVAASPASLVVKTGVLASLTGLALAAELWTGPRGARR